MGLKLGGLNGQKSFELKSKDGKMDGLLFGVSLTEKEESTRRTARNVEMFGILKW